MEQLHIKSKSITLEIIKDDESVGLFKFNPSDIGEAQRYSQVVSEMETKKVEYLLKAKEIDAENDVQKTIDFLADFVKYLQSGVNKIYGEGTSDLVFGDSLDIDMYFQFMDGLAPYYKKASIERTAKYKNKGKK